jgi:sec-independent protein translocase protein TatA
MGLHDMRHASKTVGCTHRKSKTANKSTSIGGTNMKIGGLGLPELLIILAVALLIFGPKQLPKLGAALGKTVRNLRQGMDSEMKEAEEEAAKEEEEQKTAKPRKKKAAKKIEAPQAEEAAEETAEAAEKVEA